MEEKEEIVSLDKELLKNPNIRIFSKLENGELKYVVSLDSNEEAKTNEEKVVLATYSQGNPKLVEQCIKRLLDTISQEKVDKKKANIYIKKLKENSDITFTDETREIIAACTDKDKKDLQQIEVKRGTKIEDIIPDIGVDYHKLDRLLPTRTKIDIDKVPEAVIEKVGADTQERLDTLDTIKSEKDVKLHQNSLESFMTYAESDTDREKILTNYIEKIQKLDAGTMVECLKAIEDEGVEYSKLYPIYLRIQEKRIIRKVQVYLIELDGSKDPSFETKKFLKALEGQKIEDLKDIDLDQLLSNYEKSENEQTERYIQENRNIDFEMMRYIRRKDTRESSKEKEEVLKYLECKASSQRQVPKTSMLRKYIEDTQFKDENETEQNYFLYQVAQIEKEYLISKYGDVLERYNQKQNKPKSLEEYNSELSKAEEDKKAAQELYEGYSKLVSDNKLNKGNGVEEKDDE